MKSADAIYLSFILLPWARAFVPFAKYISSSHPFSTNIIHATSRAHNNLSAKNDNDASDWRDFRAKLVLQGLPSSETNFANHNATVVSAKGFAYDSTPLIEVGTILVSIPTNDLCQALYQHCK